MASSLLKTSLLRTIHTSNRLFQLHLTGTPSLSLQFPTENHPHDHLHAHLSFFPSRTPLHITTKPLSLSIQSSLSSPTTPPTTKDEAILQARTCLSAALEKPLNNTFLTVKGLKKLSQPRFQVEIPVVDDSPSALSELALQVLGKMPIRRKGPPVKILIIWPNPTLTEAAIKAFKSSSSNFVQHLDVSSFASGGDASGLNSAEVAVFFAPEASQLAVMKRVTDSLYPKPVVIFNPGWGFEEESSFGGLNKFVGSFEVVYSFVGLGVTGVLSNRKGVVFRCVKDGVLSGEKWFIYVEEDGEMKVFSKFKTRPTIEEVENVLYNVMAINSPITKSVKFLKDLVSNVTGKKIDV